MPANLSSAVTKPTKANRPQSTADTKVGSVSGADTSQGVSPQPVTHWQTVSRGTHQAEYQIYLSAAKDLGWLVKTFDEWLVS